MPRSYCAKAKERANNGQNFYICQVFVGNQILFGMVFGRVYVRMSVGQEAG
jgi:hypothetical protein